MRKSTKLMAGLGVVAGLGIALAPLATFAEGEINAGADTLEVTVKSACLLTTDSTTSNAIVIDGNWVGNGNPGQLVTLEGASASEPDTITFACSQNSQVEIYAASADLDHASGHATDFIPAANVKANYSGGTDTTIESAYAGSNFGDLSSTATKVASGTVGATAGNLSFTVEGYKVQLKATQKPGVYTGDVTYTYVNI